MTNMAAGMDTNNGVKSIFDKYAGQYNQSRRKLIPCFDDFYRVAIELIPFQYDQEIKVLDLGAGTGLLSSLVATTYQHADITLIDLSENMMDQAKSSLSKFKNYFQYLVADYSVLELSQKFDVIVSALSIHHLSGNQKKILFKSIFNHLNAGGIFINADQVLGETPAIETMYRERWLQEVRAKGVSELELEAALERMKEDKMSTLNSQLTWLNDTKFDDVNCWYKNYSFAVFSGRNNMQ